MPAGLGVLVALTLGGGWKTYCLSPIRFIMKLGRHDRCSCKYFHNCLLVDPLGAVANQQLQFLSKGQVYGSAVLYTQNATCVYWLHWHRGSLFNALLSTSVESTVWLGLAAVIHASPKTSACRQNFLFQQKFLK